MQNSKLQKQIETLHAIEASSKAERSALEKRLEEASRSASDRVHELESKLKALQASLAAVESHLQSKGSELAAATAKAERLENDIEVQRKEMEEALLEAGPHIGSCLSWHVSFVHGRGVLSSLHARL